MHKFTTPLFVILPRKTKADRKVIINLNGYRNWHYQTSNQAKQIFCELMEDQLKGKKFTTPIALTFKIFKASKRKLDRSNPLSIIEKFFCDALVHYGCIEDDNDDFIAFTGPYTTGGVDKDNPRCEITIYEDVDPDFNNKLDKELTKTL